MSRLAVDHRRKPLGRIAPILPAVLLSGCQFLCPQLAAAQQSWNGAVSSNWATAKNWLPAGVPNSRDAVVRIADTKNNPVLVNGSFTIGYLTVGGTNSVNIQDDQTLTIAGGGGFGRVNNSGKIEFTSTGKSVVLSFNGDGDSFSLTGSGTVDLGASGKGIIRGKGSNETLTNVSNTIQGAGDVGGGLTIVNQGLINANVKGGTLFLRSNDGMLTNSGTLEATNGGILSLPTTIKNFSGATVGTIQAVGSGTVVEIEGRTVIGGKLVTTDGGLIQNSGKATLNGVTITSGSIFQGNNGSTTDLTAAADGTALTNQGIIRANSTGKQVIFSINGRGGSLTLSGGGTVDLGSSGKGAITGQTGTETLFNRDNTIQGSGNVGSGRLTITNYGVINANVSGRTLEVEPNGGTLTNAGILEATNGGKLGLPGTISNSSFGEAGTIRAIGGGTVVETDGTTINGGKLTTTDGGLIQNSGKATLNGVTITSGSVFQGNNGSTTELTAAGGGTTLTNQGTIRANSTGKQVAFSVVGNGGTLTLTGGGVVDLGSSGKGVITGQTSNQTLVNQDNTIEGSGNVGSGRLAISNDGVINANVFGKTLIVDANSNEVANGGILEATVGGILHLEHTIANNLGTRSIIQATGSGSIVETSGATIIGGVLATTSGGLIQNSGTATLTDVTILSGSTFQGNNGSTTYLTALGSTLTNQGTIRVNSTGKQVAFSVIGNGGTLTLTGGGVVDLGSSGKGVITGFNGTEILVNENNTIMGTGNVGSGRLAITNDGTVLANVNGGTLTVAPNRSGATNNGTFQINDGSTLAVNGGFTTAGTVKIGQAGGTTASLFQMSGANDYVQTGGKTILGNASSKLAVAAGQSVNIKGGLLQGFGTIQGNLINSGKVQPGDGPGILTVTGNYTQNATGHLAIEIDGQNPGTGYSQIRMGGSASLAGMLDVTLDRVFQPTVGDQFVILTSTDLNAGKFVDNTFQLGELTFTAEYSPKGFNNDVVLLVTRSATPEPTSILMLGLGLAGVGAYAAHRRRRMGRP
jgi:hypothetical protein